MNHNKLDDSLRFLLDQYHDKVERGVIPIGISFHKWLKSLGILSPDAERLIRKREVKFRERGYEGEDNA
jgi:hypothetical protein